MIYLFKTPRVPKKVCGVLLFISPMLYATQPIMELIQNAPGTEARRPLGCDPTEADASISPNNEKLNMYDRIIRNIKKNPDAVQIFTNKVRYVLREFPTSKRHNRFDVGYIIEIFIVDLLQDACPDDVLGIPDNAVLTDITLNGHPISIKYSGGSANVIIKNTMGNSETVLEFPDLFLMKPDGLYILTNDILLNVCGIPDIFENGPDGKGLWYTQAKDNYSMKNKVLTRIKKLPNFPYKIPMDLAVLREEQKDGHCGRYFYDNIMRDMALEGIIPVK